MSKSELIAVFLLMSPASAPFQGHFFPLYQNGKSVDVPVLTEVGLLWLLSVVLLLL